MNQAPLRRDGCSGWVGLLTFMIGLSMIALAFKLAYDLFMIPPQVAMQIEPGKPIEVSRAANSLVEVLVRLLLLVVMAGFGSMVANRGIKLYASGGLVPGQVRTPAASPAKSEEREDVS
ncbi:MAG: hypothetical protein MUC92_06060 [Fimbriimonadaceae bacterium]|nr:hypothetical protein [Fimbriimonadaceae bacterium]